MSPYFSVLIRSNYQVLRLSDILCQINLPQPNATPKTTTNKPFYYQNGISISNRLSENITFCSNYPLSPEVFANLLLRDKKRFIYG